MISNGTKFDSILSHFKTDFGSQISIIFSSLIGKSSSLTSKVQCQFYCYIVELQVISGRQMKVLVSGFEKYWYQLFEGS